MEFWDRLRAIFRTMRGIGLRHYELNDRLQSALTQRATKEQKTIEELHDDLLVTGLAHLQAADKLKESWDRLTPREADVVALSCLGYTNQEIADRFGISPETVKTHISRAMVKFGYRKKSELHMALSEWDFSQWDKLYR